MKLLRKNKLLLFGSVFIFSTAFQFLQLDTLTLLYEDELDIPIDHAVTGVNTNDGVDAVVSSSQPSNIPSLPPTSSPSLSSSSSTSSEEAEANIKRALSVTPIEDDVHWLEANVTVGNYIGGGSITDVFEADVASSNDFINSRRWILRISGCGGKDTAEFTRNEINILRRLNPDHIHHEPTYPFLLYAAQNITNPFNEGGGKILTLPTDMGTKEKYRDYFISCPRMTILIVERFDNLKSSFHSPGYNVPTKKIRCFWRKLFEVLGKAHEKGVMLRDPSKNNVMIGDGEIKLFDWNHGKVYDPLKPERVHDHNLGFTGPPEYQEGRYDTYVNAHAFDVWVVGGWIDNLLKEPDRVFEGDDRWLLRTLSESMLVSDASNRPTMPWLLDNHKYFSIGRNDSCILSW